MSANLKKNFIVLKALTVLDKRQRIALLATSPNKLILALCELIDNVIHNKVKLNEKDRKRLQRYRSILREIADRKVSIKKKRQHLVQTGGAILPLLIPAVAAIASLVTDLVRKR